MAPSLLLIIEYQLEPNWFSVNEKISANANLEELREEFRIFKSFKDAYVPEKVHLMKPASDFAIIKVTDMADVEKILEKYAEHNLSPSKIKKRYAMSPFTILNTHITCNVATNHNAYINVCNVATQPFIFNVV